MINVIVGYKLKRDADIQPLLLKLVSNAMQYPGFVSAENLLSEKDSSIIAVVKTWNKLEDWRAWEESSIRQALLREAKTLLEEAPQVTVYTIMPTVRWVG